jgi:hypothetical protein
MPSTLVRRTRTRIPPRDPDAAYRLDVLRTMARFELQPRTVIALVEACAHRAFATCGPHDMVPALEELLALAHAQLGQFTWRVDNA